VAQPLPVKLRLAGEITAGMHNPVNNMNEGCIITVCNICLENYGVYNQIMLVFSEENSAHKEKIMDNCLYYRPINVGQCVIKNWPPLLSADTNRQTSVLKLSGNLVGQFVLAYKSRLCH